MTHLEFFAELLSEMTGASIDQVKQNMLEYEKHIERNSFIHTEISPDTIKKMRKAAKSDPQGFLRFITAGQQEVLGKIKTQ